ncbi:type VI secretion system tube protein TssD [Hymenobacter terrenus]|uniref:type VI secretion system tube protein TssD n=1 Tax=Hymenobacter terrenus TaxID=1629124 RepID=UPI0006196BE6|nr:type VI secretion system tube protein TssD [Hymenobacter terrenus]
MASIYAELHVTGYIIRILRFRYKANQAPDQRGRVVANVVRGLLHATADVPDHHLLEGWAGDPLKRLPARLVVLDNGVAVETITFKAAYCVGYDEAFESGNEQLGAYVCHFPLSDPDGWTWERGRGPNAYLNVPPMIPTPPPVVAVATAATARAVKRKVADDDDLVAGTPEHKADRWARYQKKHKNDPKIWSEARWSKQYDVNMANAIYGLEREREYARAMGGVSKTLKTPYTLRQIDIFIQDEYYCGQLKTGKVGLSKQAKKDLQKDAALIARNYEVEYILEKGGSKPLLAALKKIGATVKIGPQIP